MSISTPESLSCSHEQLAEAAGKDRLVIVVTLPDQVSALEFMRAAEEIELTLENTSTRMINFAAYKEGQPPLPGSDTPGGAWSLVGVIWGPQRDQIPEEQQETVKTNFFGETISILESYGLVEDKEQFT